jgi:phage virion morphogenesis protein
VSGVAIEIGLQDVLALAALDRLADKGRALGPLMDRIGLYLQGETRQRFEDQHGPDGTPWQPSQRAIEQSGQTLVDSARLRDSITHVAGSDSVEVGTNVLYAAIHQFGGRIEPVSAPALRFRIGDAWVTTDHVDMPARPYLGLGADDPAEILGLTAAWLEEGP